MNLNSIQCAEGTMEREKNKTLPLIQTIINSNGIHHLGLWRRRVIDKLVNWFHSFQGQFQSHLMPTISTITNASPFKIHELQSRRKKKKTSTNDELIFPCKITIDWVTNIEMMPSANGVISVRCCSSSSTTTTSRFIFIWWFSHGHLQTHFTFHAKTNHFICT